MNKLVILLTLGLVLLSTLPLVVGCQQQPSIAPGPSMTPNSPPPPPPPPTPTPVEFKVMVFEPST